MLKTFTDAVAVVVVALTTLCGALPCRAQTDAGGEAAGPRRVFAGPSAEDAPPGDGRRTLSAFPKNLGRNVVGVFSGTNLAPLVWGSAAATTASALDERAKDALQGRCGACGRLGATMGGSAVVPVAGLLFVSGRFSPGGPFRAATYDLAQAMLVNGAYTGVLKQTVGRTRPDGSDRTSFPSGHTSTAFSLATVARSHYGWRAGAPLYALASGIALSRIESGRHHLSDVLAGATLGIIVGRTVTRLDAERPSPKRTVSLNPVTDPHGSGVGIGLSASW